MLVRLFPHLRFLHAKYNVNLIAAIPMLQLQCCGNHGYDDWNKLPRPMPVPKSCCILPNCDVQDETEIYTEVNHMQ